MARKALARKERLRVRETLKIERFREAFLACVLQPVNAMTAGPMKTRVVMLALLSLSAGCDQDGALPKKGEQAPGAVVPYTEGVRIAWDARTRQRLFDGPASYPRMIRLQRGALLASVESRGGSYVLISEDDGLTWSDLIQVAAPQNGVIAAVPSLLQLDDGTVLLAYNTRPPMDNDDPSRRFGIKLKASTDGGRTWKERATVFEAGVSSGRGVWEPAMMQLPSGAVLLFVANEYPYPDSADQEISVFRSSDGGRTWSDFQTVSYRGGHRDGMPVPLQMNGGQGLAISIEDNGIAGGAFKPAILWFDAADDVWAATPISGESPQRWRALSEDAQLPPAAYGGAPYLAQFPSGETVLSFQSNEGRAGEWHRSAMVVGVGTEEAKGFSRTSRPFDVPEGRQALWNALFIKDECTVTALSSTTTFNAARQELYVIDGYKTPTPLVPRGAAVVDGRGDEAIWGEAPAMQVGAYGNKVAEVRLAWSPERLWALFRVFDEQTVRTDGPSEGDDATWLSLAADTLSENRLVEGAYQLRVEADGDYALFEGAGGQWQLVEDNSGVAVQVSAPEAYASTAFDGETYSVEVSLPWEKVGGAPAAGQGWGVNVGLIDARAQSQLARESFAGTRADRPQTWLKAQLVP